MAESTKIVKTCIGKPCAYTGHTNNIQTPTVEVPMHTGERGKDREREEGKEREREGGRERETRERQGESVAHVRDRLV